MVPADTDALAASDDIGGAILFYVTTVASRMLAVDQIAWETRRLMTAFTNPRLLGIRHTGETQGAVSCVASLRSLRRAANRELRGFAARPCAQDVADSNRQQPIEGTDAGSVVRGRTQ